MQISIMTIENTRYEIDRGAHYDWTPWMGVSFSGTDGGSGLGSSSMSSFSDSGGTGGASSMSGYLNGRIYVIEESAKSRPN